MIMNETVKCTLNHGVLKVSGTLIRRDPGCKPLTNPEVSSFPGHLLAWLDQTGDSPCNCPLSRARHRRNVQIEVASRIEAALGCGAQRGLDGNGGHSAGSNGLPLTGANPHAEG